MSALPQSVLHLPPFRFSLSGYKLKLTALAIISILHSGCDSGGSLSTGVPVTGAPEHNIGSNSPTNVSTDNPVLTGVFIDSAVANLRFTTPSGTGRTNANGEFFYKAGEPISFSIGDVTFPAVIADTVITPLDLFSTTSVTDIEVVNLSRLLQTLDIDSNPENGIILPDHIDQLSGNVEFSNTENFEASARAALENAGLTKPLVSTESAVTHLSNSLLQRDLVEITQIDTAALQFNDSNAERILPDLDADGIADMFDWDDDGDEVADRIDMFPQDGSEAFDTDGDGIGNNADSDDDNDGVPDKNDLFPLIPTESVDDDRDGFGNQLDTDDDNDGVPDTFDAFPNDPSEYIDTDGDGIGDSEDTDDDGDFVIDKIDAFPLLATESRDTDGDGYGDNFDHDDDNDGTPDTIDAFPLTATEQLDTDGDGIGNNTDNDDDNDGFEDAMDAFPLISSEHLDSDADGHGNNFDLDDDNDGAPDRFDRFPTNAAEQFDTDNDGIGDNADTDDDGDGLDDAVDPSPLSTTNSSDIDGDGFPDKIDDDNDNDGIHDALDVFPNDSAESSDNDKDGIGDNADPDDDNDGTLDENDALPLNPSETSDLDGDGIGDNADDDSDNDGVADEFDAFPLDPAEQQDTDNDGTGNNTDQDDDGDGTPDNQDAFPLDFFETTDTDGDGIGDNFDWDRDNDGVDDFFDDFPEDPNESIDTDLDGIGDNADPDDDNDNTPDEEDAYPTIAYFGDDTDGDGELDQNDRDDDNDGVEDQDDILPKDPTESIDTDADGIGNNADTDDDNDGIADQQDAAPLDSGCSAEVDSIGGICVIDFLQNIDFAEQLGDSIYLFNTNALSARKVQLANQMVLPEIDLAASVNTGDKITAVKYLPSHDRIYVGYASGVIVHFDSSAEEATYFHTLPDAVHSFGDAGNYLIARQTGFRDNTFVLDIDGVQTFTRSNFSAEIDNSAWNSAQSTIHFKSWNNDIRSSVIDQTTGTMTDDITISNTNPVVGPLIFSPDNSLLLAANGQTFNFGETNTIGGDITSNIFIDFDWDINGELVAIYASEQSTIVTHYTTDYRVAESLTFGGEPRWLFQDNGTFYVTTKTTDGISINVYEPSLDSDNDLILNVDDAFPVDSAASVDSDGDGSPDSWNEGYSEADSTTGLIIDSYPMDPACYLAADGNGDHCYYDLIIPAAAPSTALSHGNLTFLHYTEENLVFIRDNTTGTYLTPLYVGEEEGTLTPAPTYMEHHPLHNRLYFGYESGNVTYIDLADNQAAEQPFVTLSEHVRGIAHAGQFVMLVDNSGSRESHHYYDIDGVLTQAEDLNTYSKHFAWNSTVNRLYFFRDGISPNDLLYEEISADGTILSDGDSPYHGLYTITGPIIVSPDGSNVLLGAGEYYDATSLERLGSISRNFNHAVYLDDGRLVILKDNGVDTILAYYDTSYAPISGVTTYQRIEPVGLSYSDNTLTVITHSFIDGLVFHNITIE